MARTRARIVAAASLAVLGSLAGCAASPAQAGQPGAPSATTFTNPVWPDNFADPSVIQGRDGIWYAYGTSGKSTASSAQDVVPILKSADLVHWSPAGEAFTATPVFPGNPAGQTPGAPGAPGIAYFGGLYHLYYGEMVAAGATGSDIGVATAPSPAGPWTNSPGNPVVPPFTWQPAPGMPRTATAIGPQVVSDSHGTHWLFYGSGGGGLWVQQLSADGMHVVGPRTQVAGPQIYEAVYPVYHGGYWYLFTASLGGCCDGPVSAYPNRVARSTSITGPYTDQLGRPLTGAFSAGTPVQTPNGNQWMQTGYTSVVTDLSGQDYLLTNGVDRSDPYLSSARNAGTKRQLLVNRLDWDNGWPVTNKGAGADASPQPVPVTSGTVTDYFEQGISSQWQPGSAWKAAKEAAGGYITTDATSAASQLRSSAVMHGNQRITADVRIDTASASAAVVLGASGAGHSLRVTLDRSAGSLTLLRAAGSKQRTLARAALPAAFDYSSWHQVAVQLSGHQLSATVTDAGLNDPQASLRASVPPGSGSGRVGLAGAGGMVDADAFTAAPLRRPVTGTVPAPAVGRLDAADSTDFSGTSLPKGWSMVRPDPSVSVSGGQLHFPLQQATLIHGDTRTTPAYPAGTASVLMRRPPASGTWTAQTKVTVPWGSTLPSTSPDAGLIVYSSDSSWVDLTATAQFGARWARFGQQLDDTATGSVLYGWAGIAPSASTMYLRLRHTLSPSTGEQQLRAATSVDGTHWVWWGTSTLPAGAPVQVGLVAFDAPQDISYTASFSYLHFYMPAAHRIGM